MFPANSGATVHIAVLQNLSRLRKSFLRNLLVHSCNFTKEVVRHIRFPGSLWNFPRQLFLQITCQLNFCLVYIYILGKHIARKYCFQVALWFPLVEIYQAPFSLIVNFSFLAMNKHCSHEELICHTNHIMVDAKRTRSHKFSILYLLSCENVRWHPNLQNHIQTRQYKHWKVINSVVKYGPNIVCWLVYWMLSWICL